MTAVEVSGDQLNSTSFKSPTHDHFDPIGAHDNNQIKSNNSNNPHSIDTERYNFSRRTSLYSSGNQQLPNSHNGPGFIPHSSLNVFHAKRNSILQEELCQFEHAIWETLPDNVEETDECEYEEHNLDSTTTHATGQDSRLNSSTYKVGRTQFYTCHRLAMPGKEHGSSHSSSAEKQKSGGSFAKRGSLSLATATGINGSVLTKWVKQGLFHSSQEDDKYFLVKSGTLEQLMEQCLNPHKKLDDPFFKDILLEQYCMFTDKVTLSNQILQSTKNLLASNANRRGSNSWKRTSHSHDNDDSIKENVKALIQKWKDEFPNDFQDQEALKVIETLTLTSAMINSLHLKNGLERQKRLLEVKVKCFIEQTNPRDAPAKVSPVTSRKQSQPMSRKESNKNLLPSKFSLPFASTRGSEPTMVGLRVNTHTETERHPDPRQVKSLVNRPKRRPLLRSLSNSESARGIFNQDPLRCDSGIRTPDSPRKTFCPYSPAEVARQLTFKYSNYLLEMRPFEIVQYAQNHLEEDSSLQKIIQLNKLIEEKIPSTILADLLLKSQKIGSIIEFWLKVAEELLELRNYECLQIVVHSLNSPLYDSRRLTEVWSHVDKLHLFNFEKLKETVSIEDNYQILRELQRKEETEEIESNEKSKQSSQKSLKKTIARTLSRRRESKETLEKPGFIPCINVIKKDVLGILAAHSIDKTSNGVIALAMHRKIHQQLQQIRLAQRLLKRSLQLQHNEQVWAWFERIPIVSKPQRDINSTVLSKR